MDLPSIQVPFGNALNATAQAPAVRHHILCGSFRSVSLFLLAFTPLQPSLELVQHIPGFGPHQYIGLGPQNPHSSIRHAYTTTWALPPKLHSWAIEAQTEGLRVRPLDSKSITATSSYVIVPPPYTHIYAAGGPSAQVHAASEDGGIGAHAQELYFVPEAEWAAADKTRKALRYGSHAIEFAFSANGPTLGFIPVLGGSTIEIYTRNADGTLTHVQTSHAPARDGAAPDAHDGPRHVKVHPNGKLLYCVTEHTNYLDVYSIEHSSENILTWVASRSLIPADLRTSPGVEEQYSFRGDTLMLAPSKPSQPAPDTIFVTTRGGEDDTNGWVSAFRLDEEGMFFGEVETNPYLVERYEAKTSGGKAHALDVLHKEDDENGGMWVLLTDDSPPHPGLRVLEWDGWLWRGGGAKLREVAAWPSETAKPSSDAEAMEGGSHAVWLD